LVATNSSGGFPVAYRQFQSSEIRFLCCEPLLEPLKLDLRGISWVIVGGESGPRARHMPAEWARDVRDPSDSRGGPPGPALTRNLPHARLGLRRSGHDPFGDGHGLADA
jgi:Protein of unknown function (DUF5131)